MILSICIPTYNRPVHLENCLNSIYNAKKKVKNFKFEVCISDNGSKHNIKKIVSKYKKKLKLNFIDLKETMELRLTFLRLLKWQKENLFGQLEMTIY